MSGGTYDYIYTRIEDLAMRLRAQHPRNALVGALATHLRELSNLLHDIEWADSGDTFWGPDLDERIKALVGPGFLLAEALDAAKAAQRELTAILEQVQLPVTKENS